MTGRVSGMQRENMFQERGKIHKEILAQGKAASWWESTLDLRCDVTLHFVPLKHAQNLNRTIQNIGMKNTGLKSWAMLTLQTTGQPALQKISKQLICSTRTRMDIIAWRNVWMSDKVCNSKFLGPHFFGFFWDGLDLSFHLVPHLLG